MLEDMEIRELLVRVSVGDVVCRVFIDDGGDEQAGESTRLRLDAVFPDNRAALAWLDQLRGGHATKPPPVTITDVPAILVMENRPASEIIAADRGPHTSTPANLTPTAQAEKPRRGRPPGSKNKPNGASETTPAAPKEATPSGEPQQPSTVTVPLQVRHVGTTEDGAERFDLRVDPGFETGRTNTSIPNVPATSKPGWDLAGDGKGDDSEARFDAETSEIPQALKEAPRLRAVVVWLQDHGYRTPDQLTRAMEALKRRGVAILAPVVDGSMADRVDIVLQSL